MPVKRWGPGWALQRGPPGSKAGVREPRSEAQGPDEWSAAALVTLAKTNLWSPHFLQYCSSDGMDGLLQSIRRLLGSHPAPR